MSSSWHKHNKIKYETLQSERNEENGIITNEDLPRNAVNLLLNNFVDPGDATISDTGKLNYREIKSKSLDVVSAENAKNLKFKKQLSEMDSRKRATFERIRKRLETMKNFYPDVYHSDKSVIEMYGTQDELHQVNLDVLDYERDSSAWLWI